MLPHDLSVQAHAHGRDKEEASMLTAMKRKSKYERDSLYSALGLSQGHTVILARVEKIRPMKDCHVELRWLI